MPICWARFTAYEVDDGRPRLPGGRETRKQIAEATDPVTIKHLDDAAQIPPEERKVPEVQDGVPELGDLEASAEAPLEDVPPAEPTPDIEWKQEPTFFPEQGQTRVVTYGPVKVDLHTRTLGPDGFKYNVEWYPLDAEGKPQQILKDADKPIESGGGWAVLGKHKPDVFDPPYDNPHGWSVKIVVPSQAPVHGNSAGNYPNIYSTERK